MSVKLFVVILRYLVDIQTIDRNRPQHLDFLNQYSDSGKIILSGRQNPLTGGVIIINAQSRNEVENIMKDDPFINLKLAETSIFEFEPNGMDTLKKFVNNH